MSERDIKVQAIINPISGVGSKRKIPKMIEGICSKKNCSLNISFTEYAGHAKALARAAAEEAAKAGEQLHIWTAGGDGTLVEALTGVQGFANAAVGCLPYGSGNDFLRTYGTWASSPAAQMVAERPRLVCIVSMVTSPPASWASRSVNSSRVP